MESHQWCLSSGSFCVRWLHKFVYEMFENIRSHKSKNERQCNGQNKNDIKTNNDIQSTAQETKDREIRTPLKTRVNYCPLAGYAVPYPKVTHVSPLLLQTRWYVMNEENEERTGLC